MGLMSGHSKWATIHRQKEVKDAKKGAVFTKMAGAITVAVKQGGGIGDPDKNFRLRLVVDKARQFNMPKENIARAIEKGVGSAGGAGISEAMYEGFLPGGAGILVEALTDNKVRTAQQVRTILDKGGGTMAGSGAVSYMFEAKGLLRTKLPQSGTKSRDEQELELIDLGASDIDEDGEGWVVFCEREKTFEMKQKLLEMGYEVESAEVVMRPSTLVSLSEEALERAAKLQEQLEELDDVTATWTNYA